MGVLSRLALAQGYGSTPLPGSCMVPKAAPWKSRDDAAFETLERAKHWTAFHVAQHYLSVGFNTHTLDFLGTSTQWKANTLVASRRNGRH